MNLRLIKLVLLDYINLNLLVTVSWSINMAET